LIILSPYKQVEQVIQIKRNKLMYGREEIIISSGQIGEPFVESTSLIVD
jgi:hypothetical protein